MPTACFLRRSPVCSAVPARQAPTARCEAPAPRDTCSWPIWSNTLGPTLRLQTAFSSRIYEYLHDHDSMDYVGQLHDHQCWYVASTPSKLATCSVRWAMTCWYFRLSAFKPSTVAASFSFSVFFVVSSCSTSLILLSLSWMSVRSSARVHSWTATLVYRVGEGGEGKFRSVAATSEIDSTKYLQLLHFRCDLSCSAQTPKHRNPGRNTGRVSS